MASDVQDPLVARSGPPPVPPRGGWEVVILGGGAAGLWAAGSAAARGLRVLLLEKGRRVGVKILASGGGACNLTTSLGPADAARWFRPAGERFLAHAFRTLSPQALVEAFREMGVPTHVDEALEKVWPDSRRARDVAEALLRRAEAAGAVVVTSAPALGLRRAPGGFAVATPYGDVEAPRVMVATGGQSFPRTGTTGDAYAWLRGLGHRITPLAPALVPLRVETPWVRALKGIAVPVEARALGPGGELLLARRRPLLFTHFGLSGPAALDVSRFFALAPPWRPCRLRLDLQPGRGEEEVRCGLEDAARRGAGEAAWRALPAALPERLRRALLVEAGVPEGARAGDLGRARRHALASALGRLELPVAGTRGWDHAEVTAGGVDLDEVDPGTLQSRLVPGLFLVGEVLDLDGPIGGFNFQSAFSTAEVAAGAF
jgi:predicted Rossmann fold flavoprotein